MSTFGSTSNLNDILNDLNDDELEELCENYCGSNSDTEGTNEFLACQLWTKIYEFSIISNILICLE